MTIIDEFDLIFGRMVNLTPMDGVSKNYLKILIFREAQIKKNMWADSLECSFYSMTMHHLELNKIYKTLYKEKKAISPPLKYEKYPDYQDFLQFLIQKMQKN